MSALYRWSGVLVALGILAAIVMLLAVPAGAVTAHKVTPAEFAAIQPGQTRHDVQATIGHGEVVVVWYGGIGWGHLWKNYPTTDGQWAQVVYSHAPGKHVWHVAKHRYKALCSEERVPCFNQAPQ